MMENKIAELRKQHNISQEELANILNTSRQAISKWERKEAYPDLDKLKDLATFFNVSIDYLLDYDIESSEINSFIKRINECIESKSFTISIDEIKIIVSKNNNNFNLLLKVVDYLMLYGKVSQSDEIVDLVIKYSERIIVIFREDNEEKITINSIKGIICYCYIFKRRFDLARDYINRNHLEELNVHLAICEYYLGNYEVASNIASNNFFDAISKLLNANMVQIRLLLKVNKVEDAYDLTKWCISLIKSIEKDENLLFDAMYFLVFNKAICERNLKLDYEEALAFLKNNYNNGLNKNSNLEEIKFYYDEKVNFFSLVKDIKEDLYLDISYLKDTNIFNDAMSVLNEVFGDRQ